PGQRREAYCWEISVDERPAVQQLGWTDDMMLRAETPETPLQIQMLLIYDPSTARTGWIVRASISSTTSVISGYPSLATGGSCASKSRGCMPARSICDVRRGRSLPWRAGI